MPHSFWDRIMSAITGAASCASSSMSISKLTSNRTGLCSRLHASWYRLRYPASVIGKLESSGFNILSHRFFTSSTRFSSGDCDPSFAFTLDLPYTLFQSLVDTSARMASACFNSTAKSADFKNSFSTRIANSALLSLTPMAFETWYCRSVPRRNFSPRYRNPNLAYAIL